MSHKEKRVAVITNQVEIADHIKVALQGLFDVDIYKNGLALHHAMEKATIYKAIITDDELLGANGIPLHKTLNNFGYGKIPFMVIMDQIDNEQRKLAMSESIAEIFSKPVDKRAIRLRVPYLVENFNNKTAKKSTAKNYQLPLTKRIFDIFFSGLALLLLSPLFLVIAILVRAESRGPVFYYSLRVGSGYKVFKFFKFRSMFTGADAKLKALSHLNQYNSVKTAAASSDIAVKVLCDLCEK